MYLKTELERENIKNLWTKFKKRKTLKIKNEIIESYYPYVEFLAQELVKKLQFKIKKEELVSYGIDGLYEVIPKYDIDQGIKFETFAYRRITGSMIDNLRKLDKFRNIRSKVDKIEKAREELEQKHKHKILDDEIFEEKDSLKKDLVKNNLNSTVSSLHCEFFKEIKEKKNQDIQKELNCNEVFSQLTLDLEFEEKRIVYLLFYKGLSCEQTSVILKIKESSVLYKKNKILKKIKEYAEKNNLQEILFPQKKK